jgi:hypothetical protein
MKGTTVQLVVKTQSGTDAFGAPVYTEELVSVADVLVGSPTSDDVTNTLNLYGKKIEYVLGIPKGDTHNWIDAEVVIWGERFRTVGYPTTGEQENIPLRWGQNVKVERYG